MSVAEIIDELPKLTAAELALVAERLADAEIGEGKKRTKPRTSGLGKGKWWVAEDFDDPLPDEFWLGADA